MNKLTTFILRPWLLPRLPAIPCKVLAGDIERAARPFSARRSKWKNSSNLKGLSRRSTATTSIRMPSSRSSSSSRSSARVSVPTRSTNGAMDVGQPGQDATTAQRPKNPNFVLNQPRYQGAQVLLTRANFGCGSSREHAPWALLDFGFKAIIAESFADIFFNNCFKNGILPIVLPAVEIDALFAQVEATPGYSKLTIDLPAQAVIRPDGGAFRSRSTPSARSVC